MTKQNADDFLKRSLERAYPSDKVFWETLKKKKIKIYLGIDPTGPHLHLGHATNLLVLKTLQKKGHKIILLIGDFTGKIGDPTDRTSARKSLTSKEVASNVKTFKSQAEKIINFQGKNPVKIEYNSRWWSKMTFDEIIELAHLITVQQLIGRDMFKKRMKEGKNIHLHEFLYPLLQGYDSVAMDVDAEVGGNDQTFNMLVGRDLMKKIKDKEKLVITTKLLINPKTGRKLMNKSEGGMINLDDKPNDMFGKIMAVNDEAIIPLLKLTTLISDKDIEKIEKNIKGGEKNIRDIKIQTALWITQTYHGKEAAEKAKDRFVKTFTKKEVPEDIPEIKTKKKENIIDLLTTAGIKSKSEARRLIDQGGVKINNQKISSYDREPEIKKGDILKIGKKRFFKLTT